MQFEVVNKEDFKNQYWENNYSVQLGENFMFVINAENEVDAIEILVNEYPDFSSVEDLLVVGEFYVCKNVFTDEDVILFMEGDYLSLEDFQTGKDVVALLERVVSVGNYYLELNWQCLD